MRFGVWDLGFGVWCLVFGVWGSGLRIRVEGLGSGFRVWGSGLGFGVQGLGVRVPLLDNSGVRVLGTKRLQLPVQIARPR